jgi:hypothetical protein
LGFEAQSQIAGFVAQRTLWSQVEKNWRLWRLWLRGEVDLDLKETWVSWNRQVNKRASVGGT